MNDHEKYSTREFKFLEATQLNEDDECPCFSVPAGKPIGLIEARYAGQLRPTKVYVKPDGAADENPSFLMVLVDPERKVTFSTQISLAKLMPAIEFALANRKDVK